MTKQKFLKRRVRDRMQKTGESYAVARRHIIAKASRRGNSAGAGRWHFPGNVPATTALRSLLSAAGYRAPHTGEPISEALLFGIAGGIGAGVFTFHYSADDFSSFYVAGRHQWQDDLAYVTAACQRFGIQPTVKETSGQHAAAKQLAASVNAERPVVAWVDLVHLPHRAMPDWMSGGGYHVVTVYDVDEKAQRVTIGDLTDEPITLSYDDMAIARARIKKQKHRLLWLDDAASPLEMSSLVREGLAACYQGLANARMKNFTLEAFKTWADRLHGASGKESWAELFPPGKHLLTGLKSVHDYIHFNTGGGLMRPLMAEFFTEAALALVEPRLTDLSAMYAALGDRWNALADSALPSDVAAFRRIKVLGAQKAELGMSDGPDAVRKIAEIWREIDELTRVTARDFPLSDSESDALRADLQRQVQAIYEAEVDAHRAIGELLTTGLGA